MSTDNPRPWDHVAQDIRDAADGDPEQLAQLEDLLTEARYTAH